MSINIQRETGSSKTLNIPSNSEPSLSATISKNSSGKTNLRMDSLFEEEESDQGNDELGLNYLTNKSKEIEEEQDESSVEQEQESMGGGESNDGAYMDYRGLAENQEPERYVSFEEEQNLRARYLAQLKRLNSSGYSSQRRFGPEDSSETIKGEVLRLKKEKEVENGINYCKQGLVFFANTIEMVNSMVPNSPAHLNGWSAHIMKTQEEYNEVFEELYIKYGSTIEMGPEIKLITMIAGSAFMFHLNKLLAERAMNGGNIQDILSKMMNKNGKGPAQKKEMSGPSMDSEELLRKLSNDNFSDISSNISDDSTEEVIEKPKKKRGRPAKK
jgi:hypothetical protein